MPRSRTLNGVATTLAGVFVSRNNDAAGYWGIGKLFKLAAESSVTELEFDLLATIAERRDSEDMQIVQQHFQSFLQKQIIAAHLAHVPLAEASIKVQFGVADDKLKRYERFGYGEAIECTVALKLVSGHSAIASARCRAAPHDPERESRRYERIALTLGSTGSAQKTGHTG